MPVGRDTFRAEWAKESVSRESERHLLILSGSAVAPMTTSNLPPSQIQAALQANKRDGIGSFLSMALLVP
ncbi:hypothetical protein IQ22_03888 [Pseudomonas duriflava]|uniref:Uncharacterized protein n=1 Tax=Pseudomonas duriflava TaxID=459528 RepID=A0A562Q1F7_9PSED|nr:hypothetical protein IQ22_03888 [Pseudomonas duriflava]